jgi:hypothetical protein
LHRRAALADHPVIAAERLERRRAKSRRHYRRHAQRINQRTISRRRLKRLVKRAQSQHLDFPGITDPQVKACAAGLDALATLRKLVSGGKRHPRLLRKTQGLESMLSGS